MAAWRSTIWGGLPARPGRADGRRRLRSFDVRACREDRRRAQPARALDALNEAAIRSTVAAWEQGATWRDLNKAYARAVIELGGFVRDPAGMVWGHPRGADATLMLATGLEDDEVTPARTSCSTATARWTFTAGTAARPGWWKVSPRAGQNASPRRPDAGRRGPARGHAAGPQNQPAASACARGLSPGGRTRSSLSRDLLSRSWPVAHGHRADTWPTVGPTATGRWKRTWWHPCTFFIPAASTNACGSRRSCTSPRTADDRCSRGDLSL